MAGRLYTIPNLNIAPYSTTSYDYDTRAQAIESNGLNMGVYEDTIRLERYYLYTNLNECKVAAYWGGSNLIAVSNKLAGRMVIELRNQNKYVSGQPLTEITDSYGTYYKSGGLGTNSLVDVYDSLELALEALGIHNPLYPITYRLTNCTSPTAPTEATVGDTVNVIPQFTAGYGVVNPTSDVYVTCNGVLVPSTYANGTLTFTMPDPS